MTDSEDPNYKWWEDKQPETTWSCHGCGCSGGPGESCNCNCACNGG